VSDAHIAEMRATFERLVAHTDLDDRQRDFFTSRWLEQVVWMEGRAAKAQRLYYRLRLVTVVGAVTVPTLLSLTVYGGSFEDVTKVVALCVSLLVAICAAVEGFFQFGQRWRSYRGTLERLKTEGWLFLEQAGPYAASTSHREMFAAFAGRVEELIRTDVDVYLTEVAVEKQPPKEASKEG
jgi:uncharacterized protein DUF4231